MLHFTYIAYYVNVFSAPEKVQRNIRTFMCARVIIELLVTHYYCHCCKS